MAGTASGAARTPHARARRGVALIAGLAWTLCVPLTVGAEVRVSNWMEAQVSDVREGPRFFDYSAGSQQTWDLAADWNTGVFVDTELTAAGGSVRLETGGPPFEKCLNSGGPDYLATDGTLYEADAHFTGGGTYYYNANINNTLDDPLWERIRYAFTNGGVPTFTYAIPVPAAGNYEVEVGIMESFNLPPYQNQTDLTIEGVQVLNDFDPYTVTGGRWNPTWHTFATSTPDATIDLLVGHAGWYGALTFVCVRSVGPVGGGVTAGTWTSPAFDTLLSGTNVFGLLGAATTEPAGTDVRFQISSGATAAAAAAGPFLGPDGTNATTYPPNSPVSYAHDFVDRFVVVRAELSSSNPGVTPTLDTAWLSYDLAELVPTTSPMTIVSSPVGQQGWLLRVRADDPALNASSARLAALAVSGAGNVTLGTDHPTTQIAVAGGTLTQTSGPWFPATPTAPHSIAMSEAAMAGGAVTFRWEARVDGVLVVHDVALSFS